VYILHIIYSEIIKNVKKSDRDIVNHAYNHEYFSRITYIIIWVQIFVNTFDIRTFDEDVPKNPAIDVNTKSC